MKIYLAGSITGLSYENAIGWRNNATEQLEQLGFEVLDPMRDKEYLNGVQSLPIPDDFETRQAIWLSDKTDVENSDLILANFTGCNRASIGTAVEIGLAVGLGIPIIIVMEHDNIHWHPFITEPAKITTDSLDDAIYFIAEYYETTNVFQKIFGKF